MNPRYSRWLLRSAVVLLVGILGVFWAGSKFPRNLTIENQSQQIIDELKISMGGQTRTFHKVKVGERLTVEGSSGGDRFAVEGQLADSTRIRASIPSSENLDFILLPNGQLQPRPKNSR